MSFTDDFTGTSGDKLDSRTGWSLIGSEGAVIAVINTDGTTLTFNTGGAGSGATVYGSTDQGTNAYVQMQAKQFGTGNDNFICVALQDASNLIAWYFPGTGAAGSRLAKVVGGTKTDLITTQGALDDVGRVEREGTTVRFYLNSVQKGSDVTVTDLASEATQGVVSTANIFGAMFDNYEAGALVTGPEPSAYTPAMYHVRRRY